MRFLPLALLLLFASAELLAVRPIDVRQRNRVFPEKRFDKDTIDLKKNDRLLSQRVDIKDWQGKQMSPLLKQSAPIIMEGSFDKDAKTASSFPSFRRNESLIQVNDRAYGIDGRKAKLEKWEARWDKRKAPKFDKEPLLGAMMGLNDYFVLSEDLSMQDINRYQFHRSHSDQDGLKRIPVATGTQER